MSIVGDSMGNVYNSFLVFTCAQELTIIAQWIERHKGLLRSSPQIDKI
jgi:hypothetical protein